MTTKTYRNIDIDILQDKLTEDPRQWDNLGTMICFHRNYNLGDEHSFSYFEDAEEYLNNTKTIILPLYLYDHHSGITMNTSGFNCQWDSGQVGVIYILPMTR